MASSEEAKASPGRSMEDPDVEKVSIQEVVKVDGNGMPLVPQPSRFKDDPLVRVPSAELTEYYGYCIGKVSRSCQANGFTELATMDEVDRIDSSQLHGLFGSVRLWSSQS